MDSRGLVRAGETNELLPALHSTQYTAFWLWESVASGCAAALGGAGPERSQGSGMCLCCRRPLAAGWGGPRQGGGCSNAWPGSAGSPDLGRALLLTPTSREQTRRTQQRPLPFNLVNAMYVRTRYSTPSHPQPNQSGPTQPNMTRRSSRRPSSELAGTHVESPQLSNGY